MVRNKETFERWSTKKRPDHAHSSKKMEGSGKGAEKSSTMRTQTDSGDKTIGKGMKRTPEKTDSFPLPTPHGETSHSLAHTGGQEVAKRRESKKKGRDVLEYEDDLPFDHIDSGSLDFRKSRTNPKNGVVGKVLLRDHELLSPNENKQYQPCKSSWPGQRQKRCMSKDVEKVSSMKEQGAGRASSRMRSCSSSSASLEPHERPSEGKAAKSIEPHPKHRSPLAEEDYEHRPQMHRSFRAVGKRSLMKEQDAREGSSERRRKRHRRSSKSNQSDSENYEHSLERSIPSEGRSKGCYDSPEENFDGFDRRSPLLSMARTERLEDSCKESQGRDTEGSSSNASEFYEEVKDEGGILVKSETALRKGRRDRQKSRERQVRSREKEGKKAYYLQVNHSGKPYGDGATAWRADLNKLSRTLDPSVMDVREQPPTEMATLRRRLRQNFDYSDPVDPILIRQLVGRAITQWRNTLWKKMDAGAPCPQGFDADIWSKLERTRLCPSHNEKSERMKHANRCRITLGRTGPLGEEGVREYLRKQKGVSPDYDDIFTEMQRDKGYGGRAAKKKAIKKAHAEVAVELEAEGVSKSLAHVKDVEAEGSKRRITSLAINDKGLFNEDEYVKSLESKIAELQSQISMGVHVDREEPANYNSRDGKKNAFGSKRLYEEKDKETSDAQKGNSRVHTHSALLELHESISVGESEFGDGRQKLQSAVVKSCNRTRASKASKG